MNLKSIQPLGDTISPIPIVSPGRSNFNRSDIKQPTLLHMPDEKLYKRVHINIILPYLNFSRGKFIPPTTMVVG